MHAAVLTLFLVASTGAQPSSRSTTGPSTSATSTTDDSQACNECSQGGKGHGKHGKHGGEGGLFRSEVQPQSCYAPRYGCYFGNERCLHRYPAFHGTYYRKPYNYRNVFDYPWHAGLHEPTSLFSYNVPSETNNNGNGLDEPLDSPAGDTSDPPPVPPLTMPGAQASRIFNSRVVER